LLEQIINLLNLFIIKDKFRAITNLKFLRNLKKLKIYINITDFLRNYVSFYVIIFKPLQNRKTALFKILFKKGELRKLYLIKTLLNEPLVKEITIFENL